MTFSAAASRMTGAMRWRLIGRLNMRNPPARVDANQSDIVLALRAAGCSVEHTHMVGNGFPDLAVSRNGHTVLMEVKMPGGKLTPAEQRFRDEWQGEYHVVHSAEEALNVMGAA